MTIYPGSIVYDEQAANYKVQSVLGEGGFGLVYLIQSVEKPEKKYALKSLLVSYGNSAELEVLANDASMATELNHPNIIKYIYFHDGTTYDSLPPYILMEYAPDGDLYGIIQDHANNNRFIEMNSIREMYLQLVAGMSELNKRILHRDIKPENILVSGDTLKIADFGISKFADMTTRARTMKGMKSICYCAPEGWGNKKHTIAIDIYAMGAVFYQMATNRHIFDHPFSDVIAWRNAHLFETPKAPSCINSSVPRNIDNLIMKMLSKRSGDRPANWQQIGEAILAHGKPLSVENEVVARIVDKIKGRDRELVEREEAANRTLQAKAEYRGIIAKQFQDDIISPIEAKVNSINAGLGHDRLKIRQGYALSNWSWTVDFEREPRLFIWLEVLHDDEYRNVPTVRSPLGDGALENVAFRRPTCSGCPIAAWGGIGPSRKNGFNLLLLESETSTMGDWKMIFTTNSGGTRLTPRPEPIMFDESELRKEIRYVDGAMHNYRFDVIDLDLHRALELLETGL